MKIELRQWDLDLKDDLMRICNLVDRTYLSGRIPTPYTEKDAEWWLGMVAEHEGKDGIFRAIVVDGKVAGNISIEQKSDVSCKDAELGYMLLSEYRSQGIMTEAAKRICDEAFATLDLLRISSCVYEPNIASMRVLEKCGFEKEGMMKNAVYKDGNVYNLHLFGKLK